MKTPSEVIREVFRRSLEKSRESSNFLFDHTDKFITWIIGFSVTGLSLIISKISEFNSAFTALTVKSTLYLLSLSIIAGVLYRLFSYFYQLEYRKIELYLEIALTDIEVMKIEPEEVSGISNYREIVRRLKTDFGEDLTHIIEVYNQANPEQKDKLLADLKDYHQTFAGWVKEDYKNGLESVKEIYQKGLGISKKRMDKLFKGNLSTWKYKFFSWISVVCFSLCLLSFGATVILLTFSY